MQPEQQKQPTDVELATLIRQISAGMTRLVTSGLNKHAIIVLLADETGVGRRQIEKVLDGLNVLAKRYTAPARKS